MSVRRGCHVMNPCGAWRSGEPWSAGLKEQRQSSTPRTPRVDSNTHVNTFLNNPTGGEIMPARIFSNLWPVQCELSFTMNSKIPESWHWMQGVSVLSIVTHRSVCSISTQLLVWSQKMQLRLCQTMKCWFNQYQALICTWKRVNKWRLAPHSGVWLVMWLEHLYQALSDKCKKLCGARVTLIYADFRTKLSAWLLICHSAFLPLFILIAIFHILLRLSLPPVSHFPLSSLSLNAVVSLCSMVLSGGAPGKQSTGCIPEDCLVLYFLWTSMP